MTMGDLHLSSDDRINVQSHLDELGRRLLSVVLLVVILTGIWSISIDQILHWIMLRLDPCENACINIFSPTEWAGTRWLSATLLGLLSGSPFAMLQAYGFARPGLLPSERRAFVIWMFMILVISILSLGFTLLVLLPEFFEFGHSFNESAGLQGRYDAAQMLKVSIAISWAILLVLAASSVVAVAGSARLLWSGNSGWWRLRVHGFMLMLLWLIIPQGLPGLLVLLSVFASGLVELIGWRWFRAPMPIGNGLVDLMDSEGGTHRVLYADCTCCGTSPSIKPLKGMGVVKFEAVCRNRHEQDKLLDVVKRFNADKVVLSGCMIESLPVHVVDSLRFLGCDLSSLNLAHLSTIRTDNCQVDLELAMAIIGDPWSESQVTQRCMKIVENEGLSTIHYGSEIPFGLNLQPGEGWLTNPPNSLLDALTEIGLELKPSGN